MTFKDQFEKQIEEQERVSKERRSVPPPSAQATSTAAAPSKFRNTNSKPDQQSIIKSVEYEYETNTLFVLFHNGRIYSYAKVPVETFDALCKSSSVVQFFNNRVRDNFTLTQVE